MPFPHPVTVVKPRGVPERSSPKKRRGRAAVLAALPATTRLIRRRTGLGEATVSRWLADLKAADEAHIGRWRRTGSRLAAVWVAGPGEDAPRLDPLPQSARDRARRVREREALRAELADRAARLAALVPRRDPMVAALFGPSPRCAGGLSAAGGAA